MPSARKSKPSCVRPGRGIDFRDKAAAFLRGGSPGKNTIRVHPSAKEGNHLGTCVLFHCPGGVAFRAATPWRNRGMSETQKRREELAIFVTYFFNDSKQTHLL